MKKDINIWEISISGKYRGREDKEIDCKPYLPYNQYLYYNQDEYNLVINKDNPDYLLVVISHVLGKRELYEEFKRYYSNDRIIIFVGDESCFPDMNIFDYSISYADDFSCGDRTYRVPTFVRFSYDEKQYEKVIDYEKEYEKRKFCNFIYSNPAAHPMRDKLFYEISKLKSVDSLGGHLRNVDSQIERDWNTFFEESVEMKSNYRFSITSENDNLSGYTSEKILSSFFSKSIPIYWGNPNITQEFNKDAFINCNNFSNMDDLIGEIEHIDSNKELWIKMASAPMRTEEQIKRQEQDIIGYRKFIDHIFAQDIKRAKRVTLGTHPQNYIHYYFDTLKWRRKLIQEGKAALWETYCKILKR